MTGGMALSPALQVAACLLSCLVLVCASPAPVSPNYRVLPLGARAVDPRSLDVASRLAWLEEEARFLEDRYPSAGLPTPAVNKFARRSFPHVAPYDINVDRKRSKDKRAVATVSLIDNYSASGGLVTDTAYLGQAGVGTPPQQFNLQVDTGSSQLWVGTSSAFGTSSGVSHNTFTTSSSSSWRQTSDQLVNLTYGSGAIQGILGTDTVEVGGIGLSNQSVLVAQAVSSSFQTSLFDGLFGFAFSSLSPTGLPTFFESLAASGQLTSPAFALYLARATDNATVVSQAEAAANSANTAQGLTNGGELVLGGYDGSRFTGSLAYAPLLTKSYWLVQMDGVFLNGSTISNSRLPGAIDSGTSLTILPTAVAQSLATALNGQMLTLPGTSSLQSTFLVVPCDTDSFDLALGFASQQYLLNLTDLYLGQYDSSGQNCVLGILGRDVPESATQQSSFIGVIGDTLLKTTYTVYSLSGTGSVGFAAITGTTSAQVSSAAALPTSATSTNALVGASGGAGIPPVTSTSLVTSFTTGGGAAASILGPTGGTTAKNAGNRQSGTSFAIVFAHVIGIVWVLSGH